MCPGPAPSSYYRGREVPLPDTDLIRTPLEPEHHALGAKMGEFAGWSMPIEYAGTLTEHRAVRDSVGIFDDLIVYRGDKERYLVVPNAANTQKVLGALTDSAGQDTEVTHRPDLVTI